MNRRGMSLIETLIALSMLVIIVTTFARYMAGFQQGTTRATALTVAAAIAKERLELIRSDPRYFTLLTLYDTGAGADTTGFPGYPTMRRVTDMVRDQGGSPARDRTTITVRVTWPGMPDTVRLTTVRARP
jgi:prepilin-type N-terminal cleavage/methylation domain-containing protein